METQGEIVGKISEQTAQNRQQQTADDHDDCTAQTRGDLCKGHQLHAVSGGQNGHVAGAAHVGHTQTCGNASLDGVEANQTANQSGTKESADAGQEAENQIGKAEAADDSAKFQIAQADTDQQGGGQVLHDELEPLVAVHFNVFGDDVENLADGYGDNHPCVSVDADGRNQGIPNLCDDVAPCKEGAGDEHTNAHVAHIDVVTFGLHFFADTQLICGVGRTHQLALTVEFLAVDDLDKDAAQNDGDCVANRNGGGHDGDGLCGGHCAGGLKNLGKRNSASAHAAAHDGQSNQKDGLDGTKAHNGADDSGEAEGHDDSAKDGGEITGSCLDQKFAVHAKDGAGDKGCDVEVEECAGGFEKGVDGSDQVKTLDEIVDFGAVRRSTDDGRQKMEIVEQCGTKDDHDSAAAQVRTDNRSVLADFVKNGAEHNHKGKTASHAAGKRSGIGGNNHNDGEDGKNIPRQIK